MNHSYGRLIAESLATRRPHTGKEFFVLGSAHANWEELSEMFPTGPEGKTRVFTDLQAAVDQTAASGDDVIFIAPGYTENITAAGDIDINNAHVTIIGLGEGDQRPTFTFNTATTSDLNVDGAGITFENIRFDLTGIDALTAPLDINAASCVFRNCEFIVASATNQALLAILTDANADDLIIDKSVFRGTQTAGTTSAIRIVGSDNVTIKNSSFIGNYKASVGAIEVTTTAAGNLRILNNTIVNTTASSTAAMNFIKGTTAVVAGNTLGIKSSTSPVKVGEDQSTNQGGGSVWTGNNYYKNTTNAVAGTLL